MKYVFYNPNPMSRMVGDCAVRAVAKALDIDWEQAYALIAAKGYVMGDVISSNAVWGAVLREYGFYRAVVPNTCPECYTAEDFLNDFPHGIYTLCFNEHVATAIDGTLFDSWDSRHELVQFYWYRKD